jgi:hypothetical protein
LIQKQVSFPSYVKALSEGEDIVAAKEIAAVQFSFTGLGLLAQLASVLHRESQNGDVLSRYLPFPSLIQKGAFSGLSMRNRGIPETSPTRLPLDL